MCPECVCTIPKGGNSDTPVRGITVMNKTFTPTAAGGGGFVNTARGGRRDPDESVHHDTREEIREFRLELMARLEEQTKQYALLQNRFIQTENELYELRKIMEVVQEKANKVDIVEKQVKNDIQNSTEKPQLDVKAQGASPIHCV